MEWYIILCIGLALIGLILGIYAFVWAKVKYKEIDGYMESYDDIKQRANKLEQEVNSYKNFVIWYCKTNKLNSQKLKFIVNEGKIMISDTKE